MNGLKITRDNLGTVLAGVEELTKRQVLVGVPAEEAFRRPEDGEPGEPINNAALAFIHENGVPENNLPARPFLVPGVKAIQEAAAERYAKAAGHVLDGHPVDLEKAHHAVGLMAQNSVRATITKGEGFAALAPSTLAARRRRGRKGIKPLIDTGQLRNAQTYVIRTPGEGAE